MGSVGQREHPARQAATLASTAPDLAQRYTIPAAPALDYQVNITAYTQNSHWGYHGLGGYYGGLGGYGWYGGGMAGWWNPWWYGAYGWLAEPAAPALDPGFWNLRSAVDKVLAAGSQYAGGYDSHPFELLDTAWLPIVPAELPGTDASSSVVAPGPSGPGLSLSGLAFGVLSAALSPSVAITVATAVLGGTTETTPTTWQRAWKQEEVLRNLELIDEDMYKFWAQYGSISPSPWKPRFWFWSRQTPETAPLPLDHTALGLAPGRVQGPMAVDLDLILARGTDAASIYAIRVPDDWDSEKVASHIVALLTTNANRSSSWANAFAGWLYNIKQDSAAYENWLCTVKMEILRKAGQNAELYLKLAVGALPGGSGVFALDSLSKGNYAEASLEVFFLIPWLRFAGGRLNHIKIVARNGDEVIVSRQAVEAWQQVVYNGGEAGLKRAEGLGQALKAGGRNADDIVDALKNAKVIQAANPRTFSRSANFTPSTGRTYKVFLRNDINWDHVRTAGPRDFIGKTNAEAARAGLRPQLADGSFATLHHSQQSALGPWFEASTRYHNIHNAQRAPLHPYGASQHPHHPLGRGPGSLREQFQRIESPEYWIWREANR